MGNKTNKAAGRLKAIELLDEWLSDKSDYDEVTWPKIEKALRNEGPAMKIQVGMSRYTNEGISVGVRLQEKCSRYRLYRLWVSFWWWSVALLVEWKESPVCDDE